MVKITETSVGNVVVSNIDTNTQVDSFTSAYVYEDTTYKRYIIAQGSTIVYKTSFEESIYIPYTAPPALP